jgi:ketosteroid isomerase-like protein
MRATPLSALTICAALLLAGCAGGPAPSTTQAVDIAALTRQVADTETAFAATMAARDFAGFQQFIADDAVFYSSPEPLRGRAAVARYWKRFFEDEKAPFSWAPEQVDVLRDGQLASTSGPVRDGAGRPIARFYSIWRQEAPGRWRIVFDKGEVPCQCVGERRP